MNKKWIQYTLFFILLNSYAIFSQEKEKEYIEIEEEIGEISLDEAESDDENQIVVIGEDEQIVRLRRSPKELIKPTDTDSVRWRDSNEFIEKQGKGIKKREEKSGDITFLFGPYSSLLFDMNLLKFDKFGAYKVNYNRASNHVQNSKLEKEGNSYNSFDQFGISTKLNLAKKYNLVLNGNYTGSDTGLQNNQVFSGQKKEAGAFILSNQFKITENMRMDLNFSGTYVDHNLKKIQPVSVKDHYYSGGSNMELQYVLSRFTLNSAAYYRYHFLQKSTNSPESFQSGSFFLLPGYRMIRSTAGKKNVPFAIDLSGGGSAYYHTLWGAIFNPHVQLDMQFGWWYTQFIFKGESKDVDIVKTFIDNDYRYLEFYPLPEKFWVVSWLNSYPVLSGGTIHSELSFYRYLVYYDFSLNPENMYHYETRKMEKISGRIIWNQPMGESFYLEQGLQLQYSTSSLNNFEQITSFSLLGYNRYNWKGEVELLVKGARHTSEIKLDPVYLINLLLEKRLNPSVSVVFKGENLLNKLYYEIYPYKKSSLTLYAGLKALL